jgi:hypothetical protein
VVVALVALVALAIAGLAEGRGGDVRVVTSGNRSERHETIPITRTPQAAREVAMSLSPQRLPDLATGDRLRITAELQTTNNCHERTNLCVSRPYQYSPRIGTKLVIARRPGATRGPDAKGITKRRESNCDQQQGNRQHHCVAVYLGSKLTIPTPDKLPCQLDRCRINLVVDSHHPRAHRGDELILGIDRPGGKVSGDRSRLNATRLRGSGIEARKQRTRKLRRHRVPVKEGPKRSVLSMRLRNLTEGQQLTFAASLTVDIRRLHYSSFTGSQLILARRPGAVKPSALTRAVGSLKGEVTEANGFNCTQRTTPCTARRVGTLVIEQTPVRDGRTVPLYVNFVLRNAPKEVPDRVHDFMRLRGGGITARRYR